MSVLKLRFHIRSATANVAASFSGIRVSIAVLRRELGATRRQNSCFEQPELFFCSGLIRKAAARNKLGLLHASICMTKRRLDWLVVVVLYNTSSARKKARSAQQQQGPRKARGERKLSRGGKHNKGERENKGDYYVWAGKKKKYRKPPNVSCFQHFFVDFPLLKVDRCVSN